MKILIYLSQGFIGSINSNCMKADEFYPFEGLVDMNEAY